MQLNVGTTADHPTIQRREPCHIQCRRTPSGNRPATVERAIHSSIETWQPLRRLPERKGVRNEYRPSTRKAENGKASIGCHIRLHEWRIQGKISHPFSKIRDVAVKTRTPPTWKEPDHQKHNSRYAMPTRSIPLVSPPRSSWVNVFKILQPSVHNV